MGYAADGMPQKECHDHPQADLMNNRYIKHEIGVMVTESGGRQWKLFLMIPSARS